ncbi:MAG: hypothetical protein ACW986_12520 [Promethearchaeota archaeon]
MLKLKIQTLAIIKRFSDAIASFLGALLVLYIIIIFYYTYKPIPCILQCIGCCDPPIDLHYYFTKISFPRLTINAIFLIIGFSILSLILRWKLKNLELKFVKEEYTSSEELFKEFRSSKLTSDNIMDAHVKHDLKPNREELKKRRDQDLINSLSYKY